MSAGGLELPIAKAAACAVSRLASPLLARAVRDRNLRQAAQLLDRSEVVLPGLTPAQAASVAGYVSSRDFHVVAVQVALSALEEMTGRAVTVPDAAVTQQLTEGLRARGEWAGGTLRQVVDVLIQDLSRDVTTALQQATGSGFSATELAAIVENAGDQAAAALRNSSLLQRLTSLEAIHRFERDLREQIRALSQNIRVSNAGGLRFVAYDTLYVEPVLAPASLSAAQIRLGMSVASQLRETVAGSELLERFDRIVVLGDPGGGKSTLAAKTVHHLASDPAGAIPLLMVLRDHVEEFRAGRATIAEHLAGLCRSPHQVEPPPDALEYLLLSGRAVVIFDGLDEVFEPSVRRMVAEAIHGFAHRYPNTPILVTSRKVGYDESPLDAGLFSVTELQEFSEAQVAEYARKWFALDRTSLADKFMAESELVADLRTNPLMLSLMCGLYRAEGYIPANRPDVYEKCAMLLFERWDKQRGIVVPLPFDAHVRQAIQSLAWWLYTEPAHQAGLTRARLLAFMTEFLYRERFPDRADAENAAASFIDFCTGRAWVLSKTGVSGDQEVFGFTHRTFLEYFAATHMVRRHPDAARLFDQLQPHLRRADWEVVGQLALQTLNRTVENGANDFLNALISVADEADPHERSNLLAFAARSLTFVVPNPMVVRRVVAAIVSFFLEMPDYLGNPQIRYLISAPGLQAYDQPLVTLRECTGELAPDIGRVVVESVMAALVREPVSDNVLLLCEDPRFFLARMAELPPLQKDLAALSASYHSLLENRSFIWHDIRRVLDNALPVAELVERHGVRALYLSVQLAVIAGGLQWAESIYSQIAGRRTGRVETLATDIAGWLPSCAQPWIQNPAILDPYKIPGGDHNSGDSVNRGTFFAALLLMRLPVIEYLTEKTIAFSVGSDHVLGDVVQACALARASLVPTQQIRDMLVPRAVPASVADFVVRWASNEFSLMA